MKQKPEAVSVIGEDAAPTKKRKKYWGWLVMLIIFVLVVGTTIGSWAISNSSARSAYADQIAAGNVSVLTIPRFGDDFSIPIIEGTSSAALHSGVGWYEGTAAVGEIGNFALAGYRLGWGQPFADFDTLEVGDEIRVIAGETTYVYQIITGPTTVGADDNSLLAPVPSDPNRRPTKALITLTTAGSILPSPNRLVVIGELTETV
ncbi:MAG: sortase [Propionibacteriaceae bacterium]|nr:sortase [Propionibacteriaceae bacterium]